MISRLRRKHRITVQSIQTWARSDRRIKVGLLERPPCETLSHTPIRFHFTLPALAGLFLLVFACSLTAVASAETKDDSGTKATKNSDPWVGRKTTKQPRHSDVVNSTDSNSRSNRDFKDSAQLTWRPSRRIPGAPLSTAGRTTPTDILSAEKRDQHPAEILQAGEVESIVAAEPMNDRTGAKRPQLVKQTVVRKELPADTTLEQRRATPVSNGFWSFLDTAGHPLPGPDEVANGTNTDSSDIVNDVFDVFDVEEPGRTVDRVDNSRNAVQQLPNLDFPSDQNPGTLTSTDGDSLEKTTLAGGVVLSAPQQNPPSDSEETPDDQEDYSPIEDDLAINLFGDDNDPKDLAASRFYNEQDCGKVDAFCERLITSLRAQPLNIISLDITPSFQTNRNDPAKTRQARDKRFVDLPSRKWRDRTGQIVAEGYFRDYRNGLVHVETDGGLEVRIPYLDLGNDELCFVAAWWGLPSECLLGAGGENSQERQWTPLTLTWKSSGLCHKPLYFEQIQLERTGHTCGPIMQPLLSGAHFFGSVAALPYKMGIHPPLECQYALGYYRPGSCAPFLIPPVPLSVRGALAQTGAVLGLIYTIP